MSGYRIHRPGERINRQKPLSFIFDNVQYKAFPVTPWPRRCWPTACA
jgi:hypothetical protein